MGSEMQDDEIVQLLWDRKEEGIAQLQAKYKRYCGAVARRIVVSPEDTEECLNDTWLRAWNSIPPHHPENLAGYLAKIVRNLALNSYKKQHRKKRGGDVVTVALEELSDCLSDGKDALEEIEKRELSDMIAEYLRGKSREQQAIFIKRYFYLMEIKELAGELQMKENTIKSILFRMRKELKVYLEGEGVYI
ncbi:MAG: RNA polymerase sigma factor [Lachnospiraceae bacterium]|nr:RNA polymerase sigma factor [Lachnospiraceae bacterium]